MSTIDSLPGLFGDEKILGKPVCSDLGEQKPTILLAKTLELADEEVCSRLIELSGKEKYSSSEKAELQQIIRISGAEEWLNKKMDSFVSEAEKCLTDFPDNEYRRYFAELLHFFKNRDI